MVAFFPWRKIISFPCFESLFFFKVNRFEKRRCVNAHNQKGKKSVKDGIESSRAIPLEKIIFVDPKSKYLPLSALVTNPKMSRRHNCRVRIAVVPIFQTLGPISPARHKRELLNVIWYALKICRNVSNTSSWIYNNKLVKWLAAQRGSNSWNKGVFGFLSPAASICTPL